MHIYRFPACSDRMANRASSLCIHIHKLLVYNDHEVHDYLLCITRFSRMIYFSKYHRVYVYRFNAVPAKCQGQYVCIISRFRFPKVFFYIMRYVVPSPGKCSRQVSPKCRQLKANRKRSLWSIRLHAAMHVDSSAIHF